MPDPAPGGRLRAWLATSLTAQVLAIVLATRALLLNAILQPLDLARGFVEDGRDLVHRLALHAVPAEAIEQHGAQVAHGAPHRAAIGPLAHRRELGQAREQRLDFRLLR